MAESATVTREPRTVYAEVVVPKVLEEDVSGTQFRQLIQKLESHIRQQPRAVLNAIATFTPRPPENSGVLTINERTNISPDYSHTMRGKQTIAYDTEQQGPFVTKYVTTTETGSVDQLKHERQILEKLSATGVTPRPGELKVYPNGMRARLIMERLPGQSLDRLDISAVSIEDVVMKTAQTLSRVHGEGVCIGDVNAGTFLFDASSAEPRVFAVDMEFATDTKAGAFEVFSALTYISQQGTDLGYKLQYDNMNIRPQDALVRSDIHAWARVMADCILGEGYACEDCPVSPEHQDEYDKALTAIRPDIERAIAKTAHLVYGTTDHQDGNNETLKEHIQSALQEALNRALIGYTFKERIHRLGISLPDDMTDFIERALQLNILKRPAHFHEWESFRPLNYTPVHLAS